MNKPGIKTTEFWVTILTAVFAIFGGSLGLTGGETTDLIAKLAAGIVTVIYIVSRAMVKSTEAKANGND